MTIPKSPNTVIRLLLVLTLLWSIQTCAPTSTRHRPVQAGKPSKIVVPPEPSPAVTATRPEVSAEVQTPPAVETPVQAEPPVAVETPAVDDTLVRVETPAATQIPAAGETTAWVDPEEAPRETEPAKPALSTTIEEPSPEPASSATDTPEAPAQVAALMPIPQEASETVQPPAIETDPTHFVHVVRWKGETLSLISQWYTGTWRNWEALADANAGIDPDRITIGNRIRIPERLLKTRDLLPTEFIPAPSGPLQPKNKEERSVEAGTGIDLFGPVEAAVRQEPDPEEMELYEPEEIAEASAGVPEETGLFGPME